MTHVSNISHIKRVFVLQKRISLLIVVSKVNVFNYSVRHKGSDSDKKTAGKFQLISQALPFIILQYKRSNTSIVITLSCPHCQSP